MRYLTVEEVIAINQYLIIRYSEGEIIGVKEPSLLESAVYRPMQSAFGEDAYKSIYEKAAALLESLAKNHCFHNANKRTALVSMIQFLAYNGYAFNMPKKAAEDFIVDLVNHHYSFELIAGVIKEYCSSR